MADIDPKYIGKLTPEGAYMLERSLREYQDAARRGIVTGIRILSGPGCAVAEAQEGVIYHPHSVPTLPLPGCARAPCCACCYNPVVLGLP
jgi:hypothetical protein